MEKNATIKFRNQDYEVFWQTEYCQHILENYAKPTHGIDFRGINQVLRSHTQIEPHKRKFRIIGDYQG